MKTHGWPDIHVLRARIEALGANNLSDQEYEEIIALNRINRRSEAYAHGWGTNIPLLASVVGCTHGPILEIGSGSSSTPLLVEMARGAGRRLVTLDSNAEWLAHNSDLGHPELRHFKDWTKLRDELRRLEGATDATSSAEAYWSVAFIDNDPGPSRLENAKVCASRCEFLVVHDTLNTWFEGMDAFLDTFEYRYDYTAMTACTSVVSNARPYPGSRS